MRKSNQEVLSRLTFLQREIDNIKKSLYLEADKYEVIAIHRDGFSFVGINDHLGNGDQILICAPDKIDAEIMKRGIQSYFTKMNPTHDGRVVVYSDIPLEDLDEHYRTFVDVMSMQYHDKIDEELIQILKDEYVKDNHREEHEV